MSTPLRIEAQPFIPSSQAGSCVGVHLLAHAVFWVLVALVARWGWPPQCRPLQGAWRATGWPGVALAALAMLALQSTLQDVLSRV